jgi:hypothetical protein
MLYNLFKVLRWSAAVWWVSVILVGRRMTEKTLREQIQTSGSTLMFSRFKSLLGVQARIEEVTQTPARP